MFFHVFKKSCNQIIKGSLICPLEVSKKAERSEASRFSIRSAQPIFTEIKKTAFFTARLKFFSDLQDQVLEATKSRLRAGHVLNIMPGLHIPADPIFPEKYHNIGVRIEDTIALTKDGAKILTDLVPREIHEIEGILGLEI